MPMNDFTKEELEYIAEAIEMWFKDYDSETPERIYLKVQSMIDNYCEHQWIVISEHKLYRVGETSSAIPICNKCGQRPKTTI